MFCARSFGPSFCLKVLLAFLLLGTTASVEAGLKLYFIRHAQGGHNVVKKWQDKPKEEWPSYVGNENMFTPLGEEQAAAVPAKLAAHHFDFIACSPLWRTRHTILGYLKEKNLKAEIWPELEEHPSFGGRPPLAEPSPALFTGGPEIKLPEADIPFFTFREGFNHRIKVSKDEQEGTADVNALAERKIEMIRSHFAGKDQSILLVGHGSNGIEFMKRLVRHRPRDLPYPTNTGLWLLEEQPDGAFIFKMINDQPVP